MKYNKGDRVLYNRLMFGTVWSDQFHRDEVNVVFDREKGQISSVRADMLELVSDAQHEAVLAGQINSTVEAEKPGLAGELVKELIRLADALESGAKTETDVQWLRMTMRDVSHDLRGIAEDL